MRSELLLGQSSSFGSLILWLIILLILIGGSVGGIYYLRWWMKSHGGEGEQTDLTLQDLRQMHDEGRLTKTEYEAARHVILGKMGQAKDGDGPKH